MKEEYIKTIREACIKANPDILKLEFGCEVENKLTGLVHKFIRSWSEKITRTVHLSLSDGDVVPQAYSLKDFKHLFKILGRPIRLADVLVALARIGTLTMGAKYLVNLVEQDNGTIGHDVRWNLRQDRLEDQSEECLKFLANILE